MEDAPAALNPNPKHAKETEPVRSQTDAAS